MDLPKMEGFEASSALTQMVDKAHLASELLKALAHEIPADDPLHPRRRRKIGQ